MQNRYAGDIGDFSKFILLKKVFGDKKIGLNWYLYPDESHTNDGVHTNYNYENDFGISKILNTISCNHDKRNVDTLEKEMKKIFKDIEYFSELIEKEDECEKDRVSYRQNWFNKSIKKFKDKDVIFVDPDNGIEVSSISTKGRKKAGKYIFYDEIKQILALENVETLVIYQHYKREKNFKQKIVNEIKEKLSDELNNKNLYAVSFHKLSARVYIIVSKKDLSKELETFANENQDWRF